MEHVTREMLEQYHDGELRGRGAGAVESHVAACPQCKTELGKLGRMRNFLVLMSESEVADVSFEGFASRVDARIERERRPELGERLSVWLGEFFEHRRVVWIPAAVAVAAVLAVVLAIPFVSGGPAVAPLPAGGGIRLASAPPAAPVEGRTVGSEIASVSYGSLSGMVFEVADGRGGTAAVVWINENR
ncbi:MAG: zf-HC2 domain-containing protein [Deltaproteobacteria bacterium]|nr:zf-HC2 domain-containing protein [Deltaproteobacteria bacterium]